MKNRSLMCVFGVTLLLCFIPADRSSGSAPEQEANQKILVEIFLAPDRKGDIAAIKKEFAAVSITKVRTQFFKLGNPPENIAFGPNIPADIARLAIRLALSYNRGIKLLLPEERIRTDYIAIGTSIFDESFQRPITPEQLKQLSDPSLTTDQFHALYRKITREDQRKQ
jgi:hypothetical protein